MAGVDPFERLHLDEVAVIVELLPPVDLVRLRRVSRLWNSTLNSEHMCKIALQTHFPSSRETIQLRDSNSFSRNEQLAEPSLIDGEVQNKGRSMKGKGKAAKNKGTPRGLGNSSEIKSLSTTTKLAAPYEPTPPAVLGFRRAVFRLHSRAMAKPTHVHKYRLHHICDRGFVATARYLFWCESNRRIWQQKIGDGISGRRHLSLAAMESAGTRVAHVHQITAVENVTGRNGGGLIVLLFREIMTWGLEMAAVDYTTDEVAWKVPLSEHPHTLQRMGDWVYYITQTLSSSAGIGAGPGGIGNQEYQYTLVVHCILTGKVISRTVLDDSWPRLKRPGFSDYAPETPGAYAVFPSTGKQARPEKMIVAFENKNELSTDKPTYKVLIYSIGRRDEDAVLLKELDLRRSGIGICWNLGEKAVRIEFNGTTNSQKPGVLPNIILVEHTSHPHINPLKTRSFSETLEFPTLSVWTIDPISLDVVEVRRYQSNYDEHEKRPMIEEPHDPILNIEPTAEFTRMEALDVDSGINWVIFDENKGIYRDLPSDGSDDEAEDHGFRVMRPWNYNYGVQDPKGARIDACAYEEVSGRGEHWNENSNLVTKEVDPYKSRKRKREPTETEESSLPSAGSMVIDSTAFPPHLSPPTLAAPPTPPSPALASSVATPTPTSSLRLPKERWFRQVSRHKLKQPEIMRRRRRRGMGEEEEDWQLMPVRTMPSIMLGGNNGKREGEANGDGRYVVVLSKVVGWSVMVLCLDFEPDW